MVDIRHNWTVEEVQALFEKPFMDLLFEAQLVHREYHPANEVQVSTLLSIKTGACPKTANTALRAPTTAQTLKKNVFWKSNGFLMLLKRQKVQERPGFVWGPLGKTPKSATCHTCSIWFAALKAWVSKPV